MGLTPEQANLLLRLIQDETSAVKCLYLRFGLEYDCLSQLDSTSFLGAFNKLEQLHLDADYAYAPQLVVTGLCESIAAGTKLKKLGLFNLDLSKVDPLLLARIATQMEVFSLNSQTQIRGKPVTKYLTRKQLCTILEAIAEAPRNLKELEICPIPTHVDAELLARVASRLMGLSVWHLSTQQAEAILTRTLKGTSLKKLLLKHIQGEDQGLGLISAVEKVIPEVSIDKGDDDSYSDSVSESESYESGSCIRRLRVGKWGLRI